MFQVACAVAGYLKIQIGVREEYGMHAVLDSRGVVRANIVG